MGLTKNNHLVFSYEGGIAENMRFKAETYYQYLTNIPVESDPSSFSLANTGSGFTRFFPDTLINNGIGRNYGLELTLEKFFRDGYYFLITGSVFDAKYQGSNEVWRNTTFNGNYAMNALFAKEISFKKGGAFSFGGKATFAGGRRYGDVDEEASQEALEIVWAETDNYNEKRFKPYFRMDLKLGYVWNRPHVTHEFSIDLINVFNIENILTLTYAPNAPEGNPIREEYQLGFLPVFYYKIDF